MKAESVPLNGIKMYFEMEGAGDPLLLLHGGTGCQENWAYAGGDHFAREYSLIKPDARGHGRSSNPLKAITHRQCALDTLALLDHLGVRKCRAIGVSMGGNILLHMATLQPERIEAMVVVSATMYFHEQARAIMRQVPTADQQPQQEWETMRKRHKLGDEQIVALWDWATVIPSIPLRWPWRCTARFRDPLCAWRQTPVMDRCSQTLHHNLLRRRLLSSARRRTCNPDIHAFAENSLHSLT